MAVELSRKLWVLHQGFVCLWPIPAHRNVGAIWPLYREVSGAGKLRQGDV